MKERNSDDVIAELSEKLKRTQDEMKRYYNQALNRQSQIDELQARIFSAIKHLDADDSSLQTYHNRKAKRILLGEHDD